MEEKTVVFEVEEGQVTDLRTNKTFGKSISVHPSDLVTKENVKDVVYWHKPNQEAAKKFERIADRCFQVIDSILDGIDTNLMLIQITNFKKIIGELCPICSDTSESLIILDGVATQIELASSLEDLTQKLIFEVRLVRMLANSAIAIDPASGMEIDHERKC